MRASLQHPDDKNEALFPKCLVLLGFMIAQGSILMIPLDVANQGTYAGCQGYDNTFCGGLDMAMAWQILYIVVLAYIVLLIPFAIFYYEADDGQGNLKESQCCNAVKYELVVLLVAGLTLFLMFHFLGNTEIPVTTYSLHVNNHTAWIMEHGSWHNQTVAPPFAALGCDSTADSTAVPAVVAACDEVIAQLSYPGSSSVLTLPITFLVYVMAMMGWVGWFSFVLFAGVGLAALPVDCIMAFVYRPRHMDAVEFAEAQLSVRTRVNELIDIGEMLKAEREEKLKDNAGFFARRRIDGDDKITVNKLKQAVMILETDVSELKLCHENYHKYNPLVPFGKLLAGILSFALSALWLIQICVYVLPPEPITPFLNDYFVLLDGFFSLFGVITVCVFSMYLLCCVVCGCFKLGMRFFIIELHPMVPNGTYMNSFLFNLGVILLCSLPVIQFSVIAFADYAQYSDVAQIFGVQIKHLKFFSKFWTTNAFIYAIIGTFALTAIFLVVRPRDKPTSSLELRETLRKNAKARR